MGKRISVVVALALLAVATAFRISPRRPDDEGGWYEWNDDIR